MFAKVRPLQEGLRAALRKLVEHGGSGNLLDDFRELVRKADAKSKGSGKGSKGGGKDKGKGKGKDSAQAAKSSARAVFKSKADGPKSYAQAAGGSSKHEERNSDDLCWRLRPKDFGSDKVKITMSLTEAAQMIEDADRPLFCMLTLIRTCLSSKGSC